MSNCTLGDLISRIKNASKGHLKSIRVLNTKKSIDVLIILYKIGLIRGFKVFYNYIEIYLKYYKNKPVILNLKLISKPSKKVYWSLNKMSLKHNLRLTNKIYIVSTSFGLMTNTDCLLSGIYSGKILLQITC